jgi:hypothetical protein
LLALPGGTLMAQYNMKEVSASLELHTKGTQHNSGPHPEERALYVRLEGWRLAQLSPAAILRELAPQALTESVTLTRSDLIKFGN